MNELIKRLAKDHLLHNAKYNAYGEVIEGDYYEFDKQELLKFVESIVDECIDHASAEEGDQIYYLSEHFGFK
jgi:hypothetical protein